MPSLPKSLLLPKHWQRRIRWLALGYLIVVVTGCHSPEPPPSPKVLVSLQPLALIATEILEPLAREQQQASADWVQVVVGEGADPHQFSLQPSQMRELVSAPIVLWLGETAEPLLAKAMAKRSASAGPTLVVEDMPNIQWRDGENSAHEHGGPNTHAHNNATDPHVWWSSHNAIVIATELVGVLSQHHPQWQAPLHASLAGFKQRLGQQRAVVRASLPPTTQLELALYHDAFGYLFDELKLQAAFDIVQSPSGKPSVQDVIRVQRWLASPKGGCLVAAPNSAPELMNKWRANAPDGAIVMIDPLGWGASSYSHMWTEGAATLAKCVSGER